MFDHKNLKILLEEGYQRFNTQSFIETDPIQIPHSFSKKENIEISAFLTATIAWGRRDLIIKSAKKLMQILDNNPFDFIINASGKDFDIANNFKYRTFQSTDLKFFLISLQNIYKNKGGLEKVFFDGYKKNKSVKDAIIHFRKIFLQPEHLQRSEKHIANVEKNSAAKRINLFLMWLVRKDDKGVHFGIWNKIDTADLMLPLDVHTANMSRVLGLLTRKQNDWKAVEEVTNNLKKFCPTDPVKYDFAIFGLDLDSKNKTIMHNITL